MYRLILWSWVFLGCVVFSLQAQQRPLSSKNRGAVRLYEQAIGAYSAGRSKEALDLLNKATERDPAFVEAFLVQGDIFNEQGEDRKSTRLNSSHVRISYAVFCLKKKKKINRKQKIKKQIKTLTARLHLLSYIQNSLNDALCSSVSLVQ